MPTWTFWPFLVCLVVWRFILGARLKRLNAFNLTQLRAPSTVSSKRLKLLGALPTAIGFAPFLLIVLWADPLAYWLGERHSALSLGATQEQCTRRTCDYVHPFKYQDDSGKWDNAFAWSGQPYAGDQVIRVSIFNSSWAAIEQDLKMRTWRTMLGSIALCGLFAALATPAIYYCRKFYRSGDVVGTLKYW